MSHDCKGRSAFTLTKCICLCEDSEIEGEILGPVLKHRSDIS